MHKVISLIQFSCGCGLKTRDAKEAVTHSAQTTHTVTVGGTIAPVVKPVKVRPIDTTRKDQDLRDPFPRINPRPRPTLARS